MSHIKHTKLFGIFIITEKKLTIMMILMMMITMMIDHLMINMEDITIGMMILLTLPLKVTPKPHGTLTNNKNPPAGLAEGFFMLNYTIIAAD